MYFKEFPTMLYRFDLGAEEVSIPVLDITRNVRFRKEILANITIYDEYDILDNETPERIAEKIYGNSKYHWIIMLVNERYDYTNDFPLSSYDLEKYINDKYTNPYATHHYVSLDGYIVDSNYSGATSVSNYDYEVSINESKRRIKIVPKLLIDKILSEYKGLM